MNLAFRLQQIGAAIEPIRDPAAKAVTRERLMAEASEREDALSLIHQHDSQWAWFHDEDPAFYDPDNPFHVIQRKRMRTEWIRSEDVPRPPLNLPRAKVTEILERVDALLERVNDHSPG